MAIEVGQEAPDFTLPDETGENVTLSELRGEPVVLVFYPLDFSPPCTQEMCQIRDDYGAWMEQGAKVFGVSRDSRFTHAAFKEAEGLKHSLLADMKGEVAQQYGVWNDRAAIAERATVVIDREGQVAYSIHNSAREVRDHSDVLQHIQ